MKKFAEQNGRDVGALPLKEHNYMVFAASSSSSDSVSSSSSSSSSSTTPPSPRPAHDDNADEALDLGLGLSLSLKTHNPIPSPSSSSSSSPSSSSSSSSSSPSSTVEAPFGGSSSSSSSSSNSSISKKKIGVKRSYSTEVALSNPSAKPSIPMWKLDPTENLRKIEPSLEPRSETTNEELEIFAPPPAKDQIVGWPPVRCYRRQTFVRPVETFVKVNMDGITVGRKVDLNAYTSYETLMQALEEMFQPSYTAQGPCRVTPGREQHFLLSTASDFVLTYEDKDGDWMLVGDVPWSMFISSVRRLRITRSSEANSSATYNSVFRSA